MSAALFVDAAAVSSVYGLECFLERFSGQQPPEQIVSLQNWSGVEDSLNGVDSIIQLAGVVLLTTARIRRSITAL